MTVHSVVWIALKLGILLKMHHPLHIYFVNKLRNSFCQIKNHVEDCEALHRLNILKPGSSFLKDCTWCSKCDLTCFIRLHLTPQLLYSLPWLMKASMVTFFITLSMCVATIGQQYTCTPISLCTPKPLKVLPLAYTFLLHWISQNVSPHTWPDKTPFVISLPKYPAELYPAVNLWKPFSLSTAPPFFVIYKFTYQIIDVHQISDIYN